MSELSDFLKKKKVEYEQKEVDWQKAKSDWLNQLEHFMNQIKLWLQDSRKEGLIDVLESEIIIQEEYIGEYNAPLLVLSIGAETVKIKPVGRLIIGAMGRVDIISFINKFIVLYHADKGWIFRKENEQGSYKEFNEGNFTKILKELL
jgi:hypothetical protein